jgi:hypothetical protein
MVLRDRMAFRPREHQATERLELDRVAPQSIGTARRSKSSIFQDAVAISLNSFNAWWKFLGTCGAARRLPARRPVYGWRCGTARPLLSGAANDCPADKDNTRRMRFLASLAVSTAAAAAICATMGEGSAGRRVKQPLTPTRELL